MADNRGGYQRPRNPAPVSGPGSLARRTDRGQPARDIPSQAYGDREQFNQLQQAAPMAEAPTPPTPAQSGPPVDVIPLDAPSQNPDEPITAGAPVGPGVGPEAMGLLAPEDQLAAQDARALAPYMPVLEFLANRAGSSPSMRAFVRRLKGLLA